VTIRSRWVACSSFAVLLVALAPGPVLAATSSPACSHANLNNPGHHYGLIKNGCLLQQSPPPAPVPTLHPAPAPIPKPVGVGVVIRPAQPIASTGPGQSTHTGVIPADATPTPLNLTRPPLVAGHATTNSRAEDHNVWAEIALLGSALLLLLLACLGVAAYLRRRPRIAAAPAQ
jgi:hypothetical protein